jgi:hypothetical protein
MLVLGEETTSGLVAPLEPPEVREPARDTGALFNACDRFCGKSLYESIFAIGEPDSNAASTSFFNFCLVLNGMLFHSCCDKPNVGDMSMDLTPAAPSNVKSSGRY